MIFVTGPLYAGKREYIRTVLGLDETELAARAVWDVQAMAYNADLTALADTLAKKEIVIATEIGHMPEKTLRNVGIRVEIGSGPAEECVLEAASH